MFGGAFDFLSQSCCARLNVFLASCMSVFLPMHVFPPFNDLPVHVTPFVRSIMLLQHKKTRTVVLPIMFVGVSMLRESFTSTMQTIVF